MSDEIIQSSDYINWLKFILNKIKHDQTQTAFRVNAEMLTFYWEIGNAILEKQLQNSWGSKIIYLLLLTWLVIFLKVEVILFEI
ncbi:hypothetical protein FLA105534_01534 [Flavobacterium bizetiae]|uniref:YhcG N-terminal domain-containing protein n=1 Tax=Flavobacterium bizetiae TaxID=2704140 RepID=A0A6J4GI92_9FLAO|nr:DUF1016 N-terminal domain-containing protein [Flavobacterium bizetiae]CAA9197239.1 hypothetical protein FLA105534_01534 [Flavobacterium bizetiae]CAD5342606.1 hypothetical protein FLA105535_02594 [Flavobacterium bizetiae]CAD5348141.1 hypothetical protein FLA105534_02100 [Flavobacterium bizetiae]